MGNDLLRAKIGSGKLIVISKFAKLEAQDNISMASFFNHVKEINHEEELPC